MSQLIDIYVGRQPILDADKKVIAYELLFRQGVKHNRAIIVGGDAASAQVMMNVFGEMGLSEVLGNHKGFINFTEGLLLAEYQPFFPRDKVVIEVLEEVQVTPELIDSLTKLKAQGFTIALDDYVFNPDLLPLESLADIIKVDLQQVGFTALLEHTKRLKDQGIKLLAEKVETHEQFEFCLKLGFDYFQGYFFAKPKIIEGKRLPNSKLSALELLSSVFDPGVDMHKLSQIVAKDVSLSQKLLKYVAETNVSGVRIASIHDAVLRFGLNRLKSWASMLVLSGMNDKPCELFKTSLVRAKFCELVGDRVGRISKDSYFVVGLFSCLDGFMDADLPELLNKLGLESNIHDALLKGTGELGLALNMAKGIEQGSTSFTLPDEMSASDVSGLYLQALQFSEGVKFG